MVTLFIPVIVQSKQQKISNTSDLCIVPPDHVYDTYIEIDNSL